MTPTLKKQLNSLIKIMRRVNSMQSQLNLKNKKLFKIANTPKNQICFVIFAVLSIVTMVSIFIFSHQPAESSAALSDEFSDVAEGIINAFGWLFSKEIKVWILTYLRKIAHFTLYALLGIFVSASILNLKIKTHRVKYLSASAVCLFYSITDEFHQLFIAGRSGELLDVLIDFCGAVTGILLTALFYKIICIHSKSGKNI